MGSDETLALTYVSYQFNVLSLDFRFASEAETFGFGWVIRLREGTGHIQAIQGIGGEPDWQDHQDTARRQGR